MARGCASIDTPSFFMSLFLFGYLRPLLEPEELLVELLPLLLLEELPLLRVLLLELPTRPLLLPLVPLLRVLLLLLFTLPLPVAEPVEAPLGRLLLPELPTLPELLPDAEPVEAPLLVLGRVLVPLPVRPLEELVPLELWPDAEPVEAPSLTSLARPVTSSLFTVSISCRVCAAP